MTPIDPAFVTTGGEWNIAGGLTLGDLERGVPGVDGGVPGVEGADGASFGSALGRQLENLEGLQVRAAEQSRALATGEATDPAEVVMAVEKARLSMQLAAQLRTKGVEAITDVMRTQV